MKPIVAMLLVVMVAVPVVAEWGLSEFVILIGWAEGVGCPDDKEMFEALAQAGFNVVMWYDQAELDLAGQCGLKLLLQPGLEERIREHPANWGYYVADEPAIHQFPKVAPQFKSCHQTDADHPAYVNSAGQTGEYLHSFMETFNPRVLSYTGRYQWWWGSETYYATLEAHRIAALASGIPVIRWIEVNANPEVYALASAGKGNWSSTAPPPPDNAAKLRQSVYTSLCYGVKGIQWFTAAIMFEPGTSRLRPCGKDVVAINRELQQLGPLLVRLESVEVFHTPPLPDATRELPADHWVQTSTADVVLGIFKDSPANGYVMVANRKIDDDRHAALSFPSAVTSVDRFDKDEGQWMRLPLSRRGDRVAVDFMVAPGDGELLRVRTADEGNVHIDKGPRPDPRLEQWLAEVAKRRQKIAELPGPDQVTSLPLAAEWKFAVDPDDAGVAKGWFAESLGDQDWAVVRSDRTVGWESQGFPDYVGFGWYRQAFEAPLELAGRKFVYLYFGGVDEDAYVYLNGQLVFDHSQAATGLTADEIWLTPFAFDAKTHLRFGRTNTLAVRVYNRMGMGGIYAPAFLVGADRKLDAKTIKAVLRKRDE